MTPSALCWSAAAATAGLFLAATMVPVPAEDAPKPLPSYRAIHRAPIPERLPEHPRVFCTAADVARIRADAAAGDAYTRSCIQVVRSRADGLLGRRQEAGPTKPTAGDVGAAAALAQAYAVTGEEAYGRRCRELLLALADAYPGLKTTPSRGRLTDSTLHEGPVAVNAAMAYDLIAAAPFLTAGERRHIEQDLLRTMAWECGHRCGHANSSNWRTWALAIVASCGFAIGDRDLIEEAVNGTWDDQRRLYLYGVVQQLTHSVFTDGIHWERSIGYTYYTGTALMYAMVAARNSGVDLWQAKLPGILGPFEGSAPHEEYGPAGDRSVRAFLDAPFYYAFANGSLPKVNDSGSSALGYHPIYELAWREYGDPRYAWLIHRERSGRSSDAPGGWSLWRPSGKPEGALVAGAGRKGGDAFRLRCAKGDRAALVQEVNAPADVPVRVSAWAKPLRLDGGSVRIRANVGEQSLYTPDAQANGEWQELAVEIPAGDGARAGDRRGIRLHLFLEGGAGEALWEDVRVSAKEDTANLATNGDFAARSADGRATDFWSLVHSPNAVPEGRYSLDDDATIGITGRHANGATLFPVGGFAILRQKPVRPEGTSVNLTYGPYGSGHDHPDRLHFDLYGLGEILCPDAGSWGYDNPMHVTWANQTIAHNTLTVDETAQEPQGRSTSVFAGERAGQRVFGVLRLFHSGERMKAVRATCETAYPGVTMDRTLCLVGPYVLDVFRARSDAEHTYDLALHARGEARTEAALEALAENPFAARGYSHLTQVRRGTPAPGLFRAEFAAEGRFVQLLQVQPEGGEVILALDPARGAPTSCCIARRRGREATWVTLLEPHAGAPTARSLSATQAGGALTVVVERAAGRDTFTLADAADGAVTLKRTGVDGFEEAARP